MELEQKETNYQMRPVKASSEKKIHGGKYFKITVDLKGERIRSILITGDFFVTPEHFIESLEEHINGREAQPEEIELAMYDFKKSFGTVVDFSGVSFDDIVQLTIETIYKARE